MRNVLAEQISKMQSMMGIKDDLLVEASKLKILTDKEGLDEDQAKILDELCGGLSVWMLGRIKNYLMVVSTSISKFNDERQGAGLNKFIIDEIYKNSYVNRWHQDIIGIMDWIRVGLDGNVNPFKNLQLDELVRKSKEWHDSLGLGEGDINYVEKNEIIKDFRDENGNGFYWADLNTKDSKEESERMGHCGRSSYGYIYSLRETKPINNKFKINRSHLTTAIGNDGIMYQLKGPKNSKPKEEYHNYILPLFYVLGGEGEEDDYLVKGFGTEYASQQDFKLSDLPDDVIRELYRNRPELFEGRAMMRKLVDMGIIEAPNVNYNITLNIDADDVGRYVDGDYVYRRYKKKVTTPAGREYESTVEVTMFELILAGDTYDLYYNDYTDWKDCLTYHVDDTHKQEIREILRKVAERGDDEFIAEDFDQKDLEDIIEEYDDNNSVKNALGSAQSNAESSDYSDYLYRLLTDALKEYGIIEKIDDTGVILHIDTKQYFDDANSDYLDEYFERCDDDIECTFKELVSEGEIEKPKWDPDERWYPSVDDGYYNEMLSDYLSDVKYDYKID
jgi:hypothetical protein